MSAAGCSRYSAAKGRQFRLALPPDDSNDSDDRRQYSGPVLFQRYTAQTRDTVESKGPAKRIQHHPTLLNPTLLDDVAQCSTRWPNERNMLDSTLDLSPVRFRSLHKLALSFP